MSLLRKKMLRDLSIRRFASTTKDSYLRAVSQLAKYYMSPPDQLTEEQLLDYINFLITDRKLSCASVNVVTAGLRFFYKETLGRKEMALAIPPRKNPKKLPEILNHDELKLLFASTKNQKHRAMLMTAYAGGLRISELIRLRTKDIDSGRMLIRIENSKGGGKTAILFYLKDYSSSCAVTGKNTDPKIFSFRIQQKMGRFPEQLLV